MGHTAVANTVEDRLRMGPIVVVDREQDRHWGGHAAAADTMQHRCRMGPMVEIVEIINLRTMTPHLINQLVRSFARKSPGFSLAAKDKAVILVPADSSDMTQFVCSLRIKGRFISLHHINL